METSEEEAASLRAVFTGLTDAWDHTVLAMHVIVGSVLAPRFAGR